MLTEAGGRDLAAISLNMMSRKRASLVVETEVSTLMHQLRTLANRALRRASMTFAS
jgi:hypothetical protein